ncbi:unnamed protein product [Cylindrotheca closterium]|uniref:RRM domain-containing protein n=1 Tax=Cylindrotheca closterium TaxID=2856 RepID=A0AAD2JPG9_9STRA|nr:unnamed protein product [Cylindrotheca closterium]
MAGEIATPNNTLYVSNIDWKIKKALLRRALHTLFTRHGKVLEIITLRRDGLRGQAWVIFEDVKAATAALHHEQGFSFFEKDLRLAYAKSKSDRIAKRDGTYVPKAKRQKADAAVGASDETAAPPPPSQEQQVPPAPADDEGQDDEVKAPPSHILFAKDLPSQCNEMMLGMLFRQYTGYKEVRIPRVGLAFVEFDSEPHATLAMERLDGFKLTTNDTLKLNYGKA